MCYGVAGGRAETYVAVPNRRGVDENVLIGVNIEVALETVKTLENKEKLDVKKFIEHLTHFDPAHYLPPEILLSVFSYLSPEHLLTASTVSRAWRARTQDEKLWRACFAREGWVLDRDRVEAFEKFAERQGKKIAETLIQHGLREADVPNLERRESRKRRRNEAFSEGEAGTAARDLDGAADESPNDGAVIEVDDSENMEGVENGSTAESNATIRATSGAAPLTNMNASEVFANLDRSYSFDSVNFPDISFPTTSADLTLAPRPFQPDNNKISWPYLYKQRRRLEHNWEKNHHKMFQLPHPEHPEEGHAECVYTIQHTATTLVSGSRDKTIRIWDLNTCRLKREPLTGHEASVLCLQFDERPEQDIIVSGGSDSYVIIWKYSTGEIMKKITHAHGESVLNLRFDDRYIVTCSKDKTIKLWNRFALARDSDLIPTQVLPWFSESMETSTMIPAFTLLSTLRGHHAAVNAVMIHGTTIVSASGDRTIKAWDLHTGQPKKTYAGHTKGIACVQFDGRRIVSGSSDNTVRVFDAEQQAEVACLTGHNNLVRTVQARFGDLGITTDEELEEEARIADRNFLRALSQGMQPAIASRRTLRNAGSSRPEDMLALGARVPPGGGGSRWAKIVSGSYDESVILWKRDKNGNWCEKYRLHQNSMHRNLRRRVVQPPALGPPMQHPGPAGGVHTALAAAQGHLAQVNALLQQQQQQQQQGGAGVNNGGSLLQHGQIGTLVAAQAQLAQVNALLAQQPQPQHQQAQHQNNNQDGQQAANANAQSAGPAHHQHQTNQTNTNTTTNTHTTVNGIPAGNQAGPAGNHNQAPTPNTVAPAQQAAAAQAVRGESMRVFKLQFDARRIICCSQNKIIVGWDFANGDCELERIGEWSLETA